MPATVTSAEIASAVHLMQIVIETVRDAGRVPSGVIYLSLMDRLSLSAYQSMVRQIVRTGLVREENHELVWVG